MKKKEFSPEDILYIYNELRKSTIKWKGRAECLRLARKRVLVKRSKSSGKQVLKYKWQCNACKDWFNNEADMEVDHIEEIGGVTSFNGDWNEMIHKIFPRPVADHLQALCVFCHARKTTNYMSAAKQWERKK